MTRSSLIAEDISAKQKNHLDREAPAIQRISKRSFSLFLLDAYAILAAPLFFVYIRGGSMVWSYHYFMTHPITFLSLVVFLTFFYIFDLYNPYKYFKPAQTSTEILYSIFLGSMILAAVSYLDRTFLIARTSFVFSAVLLWIFVFCIRMFYDVLFQIRTLDTKALIVGTGFLGQEIAQVIKRTPHSRIKIMGFVGQEEKTLRGNEAAFPILGKVSSIPLLVREHEIRLLILAGEPDLENLFTKQNVQVTSVVHLFEKLEGAIPYQVLNDHYFLSFADQVKRQSYVRAKRVFDILFSILFLVALCPVFLVATALLSFQGTGKIFFIQTRIGKDGIPFKLIKFRTMTDGQNGENSITRVGQWLRKYRIDELPQMFNVLKGDMSLVGPRPEIPFFVEECQKWIPFYNVVLAVRPGLTGWAQVKFRYTTTEKDYERKFCYNLYYLKNISPTLDIMILLKTIRIILLGRGQ